MDPLERVVDQLGEVPGLRRCAILDRSGRVLAQRGFTDRAELRRVGSLASGIHATGRSLSRLLGEERPARVRTAGREQQFTLLPMPSAPDRLLLLVLDAGADPEPLRRRFEALARTLTEAVAPDGGEEGDAESFEESLNRSLERLFPTAEEERA